MLLISDRVDQNNPVKRYKAPHHMMYELKILNLTIARETASQGDFLLFLDYLLEDEVTEASGTQSFHYQQIAANETVSIPLDIRTKFVSVIDTTASNYSVGFVLYGDIIKVSKTDLILEWFRKGR